VRFVCPTSLRRVGCWTRTRIERHGKSPKDRVLQCWVEGTKSAEWISVKISMPMAGTLQVREWPNLLRHRCTTFVKIPHKIRRFFDTGKSPVSLVSLYFTWYANFSMRSLLNLQPPTSASDHQQVMFSNLSMKVGVVIVSRRNNSRSQHAESARKRETEIVPARRKEIRSSVKG
jgi:hypothetical protein